MKDTGETRNRLTIAALGLIVIGLAVLQFIWLAGMRRSERGRLQGELAAGAYLLGEDVDALLARIVDHFRVGQGDDRRGAPLQAWSRRDSLPASALLEGLFLKRGDAVWTVDGASWVPGRLPEGLVMPPGQTRAFGAPLALSVALTGDESLLIALDESYFWERFIPEQVAGMVSAWPDAKHADIWVRHAGEDGPVRYRSSPDLRTGEADVSTMFFRLPREPGDEGSGRFVIHLRHRTGSVDRAVTRTFSRNLAMAIGTLLALLVAIAMVLANARAARRLAQRQMDFVAGVSHELRTPLAVICSAGENLAGGRIRETEKVGRYGDLILKEGRRLADLVESVLRISAIRAGAARYSFAPVNPESILSEALAENRMLLDEKGARVQRDWPDDLPMVIADGPALKTALRNLIANAAKHGGPEPELRVWAEVDGTRLRLGVDDSGPGIAASERMRVREPFVRGEATKADQVEGSGLGLSIAEHVARGHGGSLEIESESGRGAHVWLDLPRKREVV